MRSSLKFCYVFFSCTLLVACSLPSGLNQNINEIALPENWQLQSEHLEVNNTWLNQLKTPDLHRMIELALANNYKLKQQAYAVTIKKQQIKSTASILWPNLDLSLNNNRRKSNSPVGYSNSAAIDLDLKYEIDLWGKLSALEQQNHLAYLSELASFEHAKQVLVADVIRAWFTVIEANKLLDLYKRRTENTEQNLHTIETGYRSGISTALDVYLTRNEVNNERAKVAEQKVKQVSAVRVLQLLIGQYPQGLLTIENSDLPILDSGIPLGLPSELITRKPELRANWYQLLAKDAALAYAHKQRFPSLSLTASIGDSQSDISKLLSTSSLAWSLLGNLTMPIFNAGKLESLQEQSRLLLKQTEQSYLASLHDAFATVENAITQEASLKQRYLLMKKAQENAMAAETLSFEQYQSGLVSYTTVLDAQSRSYDAQSLVIQIKSQLISNRINLHLALGGEFSVDAHSDKLISSFITKAE